MPLIGYLKTSDNGRISSITNIDGEPQRRKKISPVRSESATPHILLYVNDCISHEPPGGVVPVVLQRYENGIGWVELGTARCCPLCWTIITPPVGVELPRAKPNEVPIPKKVAQAGLQKGRRRTRERSARASDATTTQKVMSYSLQSQSSFSVYDLMEELGLSRPVLVQALKSLVDRKKLEVVAMGSGRGSRTLYRKAP